MSFFPTCAAAIRQFRELEDGATLVEMALVSSILFASLIGIIMISFALYTYNYVAEVAREGARYAIVRGAYCTGFSDCGVDGPGISTYVKTINFPGVDSSKITVNTKWYTITQTTGAATTIALCGTDGTSPSGCNVNPVNAVAVEVDYAFPLNIPFWRNTTLNMSSTSQLVISQ
jgi:Flp pilus assembly protein TadG